MLNWCEEEEEEEEEEEKKNVKKIGQFSEAYISQTTKPIFFKFGM